MAVRMMVWTCAVSSWDAAIQYRRGTGTDTTHWRVGTQEMTCSTRWAAVCAMRLCSQVALATRFAPAHDGQNPRRLHGLCGATRRIIRARGPSVIRQKILQDR